MKIVHKFLLIIALTSPLFSFAGNEDRAGSAGATDLLINPWARSSSWGSAGVSSINGLEALFTNVAGLAYTDKTEMMFARTNWLGTISGIGLNAAGFAQRLSESGVLGISIMSLNYGDIQITTTELPEGGVGNFNPSAMNFNLAYAKKFSPSISGGLNFKIVSQSIASVRAQGIAIDAGIRYVTGDDDRMRFGISLRNVGAPMRYSGDGLTVTGTPQGSSGSLTMMQRSERYELPSLVNIGVAYDVVKNDNIVVEMNGMFTSNSFTKDQFGLCTEARFGSYMSLRLGYLYEANILSEDDATSAYQGPAGGLGFKIPAGSNGSEICIDYSYRATYTFSGTHTAGLKITI